MILVTGGSGFIGSHTVRALHGLGEPSVVLQRRSGQVPPHRADLPVVAEQADGADRGALRAGGERQEIAVDVKRVLQGKAPPNEGNIWGKMEYGKMIAGCAAALSTKAGKIAYLGPLINDDAHAMVKGRVEEAVERAGSCSYLFRSERFSDAVVDLNHRLGLQLVSRRERRSRFRCWSQASDSHDTSAVQIATEGLPSTSLLGRRPARVRRPRRPPLFHRSSVAPN